MGFRVVLQSYGLNGFLQRLSYKTGFWLINPSKSWINPRINFFGTLWVSPSHSGHPAYKSAGSHLSDPNRIALLERSSKRL